MAGRPNFRPDPRLRESRTPSWHGIVRLFVGPFGILWHWLEGLREFVQPIVLGLVAIVLLPLLVVAPILLLKVVFFVFDISADLSRRLASLSALQIIVVMVAIAGSGLILRRLQRTKPWDRWRSSLGDFLPLILLVALIGGMMLMKHATAAHVAPTPTMQPAPAVAQTAILAPTPSPTALPSLTATSAETPTPLPSPTAATP